MSPTIEALPGKENPFRYDLIPKQIRQELESQMSKQDIQKLKQRMGEEKLTYFQVTQVYTQYFADFQIMVAALLDSERYFD